MIEIDGFYLTVNSIRYLAKIVGLQLKREFERPHASGTSACYAALVLRKAMSPTKPSRPASVSRSVVRMGVPTGATITKLPNEAPVTAA